MKKLNEISQNPLQYYDPTIFYRTELQCCTMFPLEESCLSHENSLTMERMLTLRITWVNIRLYHEQILRVNSNLRGEIYNVTIYLVRSWYQYRYYYSHSFCKCIVESAQNMHSLVWQIHYTYDKIWQKHFAGYKLGYSFVLPTDFLLK